MLNENNQTGLSDETGSNGCQICRFECDFEKNSKFNSENDRMVSDKLSSLKAVISCNNCPKIVHRLCFNFQMGSDTDRFGYECQTCQSIKSNPERECIVCRSSLGEVTLYAFCGQQFSGHFICLYYSGRFDFIGKRFIPLKLEYLSSDFEQQGDKSFCDKCEKPLIEQDSYFKCKCKKKSHIYCNLSERINGLTNGSYSDPVNLSANYKKFPVLSMCNFERFEVSVKIDKVCRETIAESVNLNFLKEMKIEPREFLDFYSKNDLEESRHFNYLSFQMICGDCYQPENDSLFCCHLNKSNDQNISEFVMCSLCCLWVHLTKKEQGIICSEHYKKDEDLKETCQNLLTNSQKEAEENAGRHTDPHRNVLKRKRHRQRNTAEIKSDDFHCCKNCFNLGMRSIYWDVDNDQKLFSHENFVANMYLKLELANLEAKGYKNWKKMLKYFKKKFHLKESQDHFILYFNENKSNLKMLDETEVQIYQRISHFLARQKVRKSNIDKIIRDIEIVLNSGDEQTGRVWVFPIPRDCLQIFLMICKGLREVFKRESFKFSSFVRGVKKLIDEKLKTRDIAFATDVTNFFIRNFLNPLNKFNESVAKVLGEYEKKLANCLVALRQEENFGKLWIMTYIQQKAPIHLFKKLQAEFEYNYFCRKALKKFNWKIEFEFLTNIDQLKQFSEYQFHFEKLLRAKSYDPQKYQLIKHFVDSYFNYLAFRNKNSQLEIKIEKLKHISNDKTFLEDFKTNMESLVLLKDLEDLINNELYEKIEKSFCEGLYQRSQAMNFAFTQKIEMYNLSPDGLVLKDLIRWILGEVITQGLAISIQTLEFLQFYRHQYDCEHLVRMKTRTSLEEFERIFRGIDPRYLSNLYPYKQVEIERQKRIDIENKIAELFQKPININDFENIILDARAIDQQSIMLRQENAHLSSLLTNETLLKTLDQNLNNSYAEATPFNVETITQLESKLEQAELWDLDFVPDLNLKWFATPELKSLHDKALLKYWQLKMQEATNNQSKIEVSFLKYIYSKPEILGLAMKQLNNEKISGLSKTFNDLSDYEKKIHRICNEFKTEVELLSRLEVYIIDIENSLEFFSCVKVAPEQSILYRNIFSIFIIGVYLKILWCIKSFNDLCAGKEADQDLFRNPNSDPESSNDKSSSKQSFKIETANENQHVPIDQAIFYGIREKLSAIYELVITESIETQKRDGNLKKMFAIFIENFAIFWKIEQISSEIANLLNPNNTTDLDENRVDEEELNKRLTILSDYLPFSKGIFDYYKSIADRFTKNLNHLTITILKISSLTINEVWRSNLLRNLFDVISVLKQQRLSSDNMRCSVLIGESILEIFECHEKPFAKFSTAIESFFNKWRQYKRGELIEQGFTEDLARFSEELESLSWEIKSLQTKIELEEEFKAAIYRIKLFMKNSFLKCAFSYSTYTEFSSEIKSIVALIDGRPENYINHITRHKKTIQLSENLSLKIKNIRNEANVLNSYYEKRSANLTIGEKLKFYWATKRKYGKLNGFYNETMREIIDRIRFKREEFELTTNRLTAWIKDIDSYKYESFPDFDAFMTPDLLISAKEKYFIPSSEILEYFLKRCFILVYCHGKDVEITKYLSSLGIEFINGILVDQIKKKASKSNKKLYETLYSDIEALLYTLLAHLQFSNDCFNGALNENPNLHAIFKQYKNSYQDKKELIQQERNSNNYHEGMQLDDELFENSPTKPEESASGFLSTARYLIGEIIDTMGGIMDEKIKKFIKLIENQEQEETHSPNNTKEIFDSIMRSQVMGKEESIKQMIANLAQELMNWVEKEKHSIKHPRLLAITKSIISGMTSFYQEKQANIEYNSGNNKGIKSIAPINPISGEVSQTQISKDSVSIHRNEVLKGYLEKLQKSIMMIMELEKNNFDFEYTLKLMTNFDEIKPVLSSMSAIKETSQQVLKVIHHLILGSINEDPLQKSGNSEDRSSHIQIDNDFGFNSRPSNKRVKPSLDAKILPEKMPSLVVLVYELKFLTINYSEKPTELRLLTSMKPELFPILGKTNIFIKTKFEQGEDEKMHEFASIETLKNHSGSRSVIGSIPFNAKIDSIIDKIFNQKLSYQSLFGGWFKYNVDEDFRLQNEDHADFCKLLLYTKQTGCLIEEVFSMIGEAFKIYIGSGRLISLKLAAYLQIRNFIGTEIESFEDLWIFIIHKNIEETNHKINQNIFEYVIDRVNMEARNSNPIELKFISVFRAETIMDDLKKEALQVLDSRII